MPKILVWSTNKLKRSSVELEAMLQGPEHSLDSAISSYEDATGKIIQNTNLFVSNRELTFPTGNVNTSTDTITITGHGIWNDTRVTFTSTTTLPGGLNASTVYFVINRAANTFQVSETIGGGAVNITSQGTGTHSVHTVGTELTGITISADSLSSNSVLLQAGLNSFMGYAGNTTLTNTTNCGFGVMAGRQLSGGNGNTTIGTLAGRSVTTGNSNAFIGFEAGYSFTTNNTNTAIGYHAGRNVTTTYNVFIGAEAGRFASGDNQIIIGHHAGQYGVTGSNSIYIGHQAGQFAANSRANMVAIGPSALKYIGNSPLAAQQNLGIGTNALSTLIAGEFHTSFGAFSGIGVKDVTQTVAVGAHSGKFNNFNAAISIGYGVYPTGVGVFIGAEEGTEILFPENCVWSMRRPISRLIQVVNALDLDGKYFILYTPLETGGVAFWFDLTGSTAEPSHGAGRSVKVDTLTKKSFAPAGVNTTTDTITITSHGLTNNTEVVFASTGTLPGGLSGTTTYFVINATANTFQVSTSAGGSAFNITSQGSGTHSVADDINTVAAKLATVIDADSAFFAEAVGRSGLEDGVFIRADDSDGNAAAPNYSTTGFATDGTPTAGYSGFFRIRSTEFNLLGASLKFAGSTSGSIEIKQPASITSYSIMLPASQGAANTYLKNDGSGNLTWVKANVTVSQRITTYTAVHLDKILADTSGGAFTINLPASPAVGDTVMIVDGAASFGTNTLTVGRNGSNIRGAAADFTINTNNAWAEFVYNGASRGWEIRT